MIAEKQPPQETEISPDLICQGIERLQRPAQLPVTYAVGAEAGLLCRCQDSFGHLAAEAEHPLSLTVMINRAEPAVRFGEPAAEPVSQKQIASDCGSRGSDHLGRTDRPLLQPEVSLPQERDLCDERFHGTADQEAEGRSGPVGRVL